MAEPVAPAGARTTWAGGRNGAIAGILSVVLWVAAFVVMGDSTEKDEAAKILDAYKNDDARILAGTIIFLVGTALFFFFLGGLRDTLLAAEGVAGPLTAIAYGGGVAAATCLMLLPGPDASGAINNDDLDASAANGLHNVGDAFFLGAEYLTPVLLAGTALVVLRTRVLPIWLAWLSLAIALVLLVAPIGWAALIFAFPVWVLIVSFLLWRGPRTAAAGV